MARKRLRIRRGTEAQWTSANPILKLGEIGYETDTVQLVSDICYHKFKIGNGEETWTELPYAGWGTPVSSGGGGTVAWADITGKPTEFTPTAHTHAWADVTGKPASFTPSPHQHDWSEITGKPTTFAPTAHTHTIEEVQGLTYELQAINEALPAKADLIDGLVPKEQIPAIAITEYLGKVDDEAEMLTLVGEKGDWCIRQDEAIPYVIVGNDPTSALSWMALLTPSTSVISVNGKTGPNVTIVIADIAGLQAALDAKAAASHTHTIANVTGLQTALDGKASTRDVLRFIDIADGTPVTGVSGISLLKSILIPAGTVQVGDVVRVRLRNRKTGVAGSFVSGIYIHTLPQVSGAAQLGIYNTSNVNNLYASMKRDFFVKTATLTEGAWSNITLVQDEGTTSQTVSTTNINWDVDQYILATVNPNSSADSILNSALIVEIL